MEALSPTMEEGQVVKWLKGEGDPVKNGEILAEIETDKATMELVARGEGVLRKVLLQEGQAAPVGEVIAVIGGEDEDVSDLVEEVGAPGGDEPAGEEEAPGGPEEEGDEVSGEEPGAVREEEGPAVEGAGVPAEGGGGAADADEAAGPSRGRVKASPLARRLAEEAGLDLSRLQGSGPQGRIVKKDVEEAKERGVPGAAAGAPAPGVEAPAAGAGLTGALPEEEYEDIPLSQMRKTIAKRLVESLGPVPHFFLRIDVDMGRILQARERVNGILEAEGEKVSINDFILRATARALVRHPEVNAEWRGDALRRHHRVHLGVAVAVEDGLITPVIRDANLKGLARIAREVRELAARGREKKLQPEEYTGSTFSVSNLGMFGIHEFTGVINPPEAGILAVGGVEETPVAEQGRVVVKPMMKVTMSCDHRVVDGATGARFLQTLKGMLEEPAAILL